MASDPNQSMPSDTINSPKSPTSDETDSLDFKIIRRPIITITVPNVLVRKFARPNPSYLVYQIHIKLSTKINPTQLGHDLTIDWNVYHRYTTLSKLHADLTGNLLDDWTAQTHWPKLAHECLPRPLPGIGLLKFPSKHLVPSIPKLIRHKSCIRQGVENDANYADYPICLHNYSRFENRRQKLETYLQNLVAIIWYLAEDCDDVADVYESMLTPQPDKNRTHQMDSNFQILELAQLKQIHKKFLKLLPIFEP